MDSKYVTSLTNIIKKSDMSDLNLRPVEVDLAAFLPDGTRQTSMTFFTSFANSKAALSDAWIAGNILLFTAYDGYLEQKYGLLEGDSFHNHYEGLPESTTTQIIEKNCYRLMKIIRNAIQHNLSSVMYSGAYDISYNFRGTDFKLQISSSGMDHLYSALICIMDGRIYGSTNKLNTEGHFEGLLLYHYREVDKWLNLINDEMGSDLIPLPELLPPVLKLARRYYVDKPVIVNESDKCVTFKKWDAGSDEYSSDYRYGDYVLPEEIGSVGMTKELDEADKKFVDKLIAEGKYSDEKITQDSERMRSTISFCKKDLERWKIRK